MTEHDLELLKIAEQLRCWDYMDVDRLICDADTAEARERLEAIKCELYCLTQDTL